jgi:hypothetical protein
VCSHSRWLRQLQAETSWQLNRKQKWKCLVAEPASLPSSNSAIDVVGLLFKPLNTFEPGVFCYRNKTERDVWITIQKNANHFTGRYGISQAVQSAIDGFNSTANFRADPDADLFTSVVTNLSEMNLDVKSFELKSACFSRFRGN